MAGHGQSNICTMTPVAPVLAADGTADGTAEGTAAAPAVADRATTVWAVLAAAGNAPGTASAARAARVLNAAVAVRGANTGRPSGHATAN